MQLTKKKYPDVELKAEYDKKADEILILTQKEVVSAVKDELTQIGIRKARAVEENVSAGEKIWMPFTEPIGRIEILKAKQIIAQRIRAIEAAAVYEEFKPREGSIVAGVIHKIERSGLSIKLGEVFAFLPKSLMVPGDTTVIGYTVRALLKEVLLEPRNDNQLILDRSSPEFLQCLFELEIPEIYEKLVEIKKVVRIAGYKSKVLVASHDKNIDPVGACIGFGGVRIKPILRELGTEKIDVIGVKDSTQELIEEALKPAKVNKVEILDDKVAHVWLDADQRSLAIGKMGQNIALACQLTGYQITLMGKESGFEQEPLVDWKSEE